MSSTGPGFSGSWPSSCCISPLNQQCHLHPSPRPDAWELVRALLFSHPCSKHPPRLSDFLSHCCCSGFEAAVPWCRLPRGSHAFPLPRGPSGTVASSPPLFSVYRLFSCRASEITFSKPSFPSQDSLVGNSSAAPFTEGNPILAMASRACLGQTPACGDAGQALGLCTVCRP